MPLTLEVFVGATPCGRPLSGATTPRRYARHLVGRSRSYCRDHPGDHTGSLLRTDGAALPTLRRQALGRLSLVAELAQDRLRLFAQSEVETIDVDRECGHAQPH